MVDKKHDPAHFLGPEGPVAQRLGGYETRPEQVKMAQAIAEAFDQSHHLVVEAGTGVGKSFAYLVPALQRARDQQRKVVISTYTISLQEQLIQKDNRYGQIVCRCEEVTEYEVLQAMRSVIPVTTLDGLKSRLRVGMGRCQGGFCTLRLLKIMQRELKLPLESLTLRGAGTEVLVSKLRKGD